MLEIRHELLEGAHVEHGFGTRRWAGIEGMLRPIQVHGIEVWRQPSAAAAPPHADAIVCDRPGVAVGIVTADCVPILACSADGRAVAAIHAGWRGLAAGVIEAGIQALQEIAPKGRELIAVVGPYIGACCYEVDTPVLSGLEERFGEEVLRRASQQTRVGHAKIDLGRLARIELEALGVANHDIGDVENPCTYCDVERFHSFRRDAQEAGRLIHAIATRPAS